jgi:FkbM family methyltransferase
VDANFRKLADFTATALALGRTPGEKARILWRETKNVRVALGVAHHHPERVLPLPTKLGTLHLRDNFGDVTNLPGLMYRNVYGCQRLVAEGVILDVGANIGLFASHAARLNAHKKIFCFEPLAYNARMIPLNCPSATVCCACVGAQRGKVKLRVDRQEIMATSIPTVWPTEEREFDVIPLDEYCRDNRIADVAFLKVDTEGMELDVLEGGREILERTRQVAMESHGQEKHTAALDRLRGSGFVVESANFNGRTGLILANRP